MVRKALRDLTVRALASLPLEIRVWLQYRCTRPLLWLLFHLEAAAVTIAAVGPTFSRYRMCLSWQSATSLVLGTYEPEVGEVLRCEIRPGDACIDIGAHIGYYAILMARLTGAEGSVVAFEPVPENFEMLQRNIELNALTNVSLEQSAVSDQDGTLRLTLSSGEKLTMHASACGYDIGERQKVIDVATSSLDSYLARAGSHPDFLQIDVEGAELAVLHGAEATLRKARPKLLVEVHGWEGPEDDEVSRFLISLGYQRTILGQRGNEAFVFFRPREQNAGINPQQTLSTRSALNA